MAATVANVESNPIGGPGGVWKYAEITLDSAYAVGGESVAANLFGLKYIKAVFIGHNEDGFMWQANIATGGATVSFKSWVFGAASTSAAQPFEAKVQDFSAVVLPVLVRGI